LQWNNFLEVSYLSILLVLSSYSLRCIIIVWTSIFSCCLWSSGDTLANITHAACSSSSTWHWCSFLTSSSTSSPGAFGIGFFRTLNLFFYLRTILTFQHQSKIFGPVNLLASSMLCRDMLLLILIYQPIYKEREY
jgi:hypothetical protein